MKLKTYLNGQWVEVGNSGGTAAENLSSTDLREVSIVGNGVIEIDTSIEYNEAMKVVMLSHTAPLDANLHLVGFSEIEGGTRLTFETATAVEATALAMAVTSAPSSISEAIAASREAVAAAQTLKKYSLDAACYSVSSNLLDADAIALVCRHIEYAAALGSPFVHHTLIPWLVLPDSAPSFEDALTPVIDAAEKIADFARPLGVTVIYEDQGLYANGVRGFGTFYHEIHRRCPNTGVCGDMGNSLFVDEGAEHFFDAYRDHILHVHVKDYRRITCSTSPGDGWKRTRGGSWLYEVPVGQGIVNVGACMKVLSEIGYRGSVGLELGHDAPYEDGVRAAMALCQTYMEGS
jgi:sugar phosphate isomerase/epimerase